ncbi:MAG: insulinase family protein, partial [Gemmatimonadales bacterium]|nr:insulinase family protein [Gemmatimonadales bacterium]
IRDAPVSDVELARARNYIAFGLPGEFETAGQMGDQVEELLTYGLPVTWYDRYVKQVLAVTAADVQRVARASYDPERLHVVVVGDAARIRPGLEALNLGPVVAVGLDGQGR